MVTLSYATPMRRINANPCLSSSLINERRDRSPSAARSALLALLPCRGDLVSIDPALDVIEAHHSDPYAEIVDAINDGLLVAEFAPPPRGATLRSIVLRRL